ncbi:unnamed protein product, partial [Owenia fusiformis]
HGAYATAVELKTKYTQINSTNSSTTSIGATYFMTYHSLQKNFRDNIEALKYARKLSDNITASILAERYHNITPGTDKTYKVFPYSIFYVFYEQYLTIVHDTIINLSTCVGSIFAISFICLGLDWYSSIIITFVIGLILLSMFGMMFLWNIYLNAISLINLVTCVGISVEFCSHLVRAFAISVHETRVLRAKHALAHMGGSVLSALIML